MPETQPGIILHQVRFELGVVTQHDPALVPIDFKQGKADARQLATVPVASAGIDKLCLRRSEQALLLHRTQHALLQLLMAHVERKHVET